MRGTILYTSDRGGAYDLWAYTPYTRVNRPLTRGLGEIYSMPYLSPNGRKIAFIGLHNIVYVQDMRTAALARIDQLDPYTLLDWSPDSRFLSYAKNGTIVVYDTVYHAASAMAQPGAADAQWFPYGERLLFTAPDSAGNGQLYAIRANGTAKTQLTRNAEGPIHHVRLSPNGQLALYTSPGASISLITAVDLATGRKHTLAGGPLAKNYNPAWSPDSAAIAYSATDQSDSGYRSLIQTDNAGGGRQETRAISDCFSTPVAWSPDGRHLAYLSGCTDEGAATELRAVDLHRPTAPSMLLVSGGNYTSVSWERMPEWH
jgi:TolB protein